jgi:DNA-binding beta-propeller fold protein YncE
VSPSGDVYATNMLGQADSVLEYSETGQRLGTISAPRRENELFEFPAGVAVGAGSKVFVVNWLQNAVQVFSPANKYLYRLGYAGSERGQVALPLGVAVNSSGEAWVAEAIYGRIEKWTGAE